MSDPRIGIGKQGEDAAAAYLIGKGYRIVARNVRQKLGEIDIVCTDGSGYVFVEVKTRRGTQFGDPLEAVTVHKRRRICRAALNFLNRNSLHETAVRFDVIGIMLTGRKAEITHIIDAFEAPF
ncbi:MAG: YraN family protein [Desulfofustis sp.]|nr:YraN family protein [Desulfofustis sp.]